MKKLEQIINKVVNKVKVGMDDALEFDYKNVCVEEIFGNAWIQVECGLNLANGWLIPYADVTVFHDNNSHESPRLEEAIKAALPTWDEVEKERYNSLSF